MKRAMFIALAALGVWLPAVTFYPTPVLAEDCLPECMHTHGCWGGGMSETYCRLELIDCQQMCNAKTQRSYGAIAYSTKDNACGWANGWNSQKKAEQVALDDCSKRGPGCKSIVWYSKGCGAVAADGNIVTWGTDSTKQQAEYRAMDECKKEGGKKCALQASQCTP
ncbi:MAG: DUF4189 domain-containing protein [Bryobacteraceae bacterium]